jgi:hypothetical protein
MSLTIPGHAFMLNQPSYSPEVDVDAEDSVTDRTLFCGPKNVCIEYIGSMLLMQPLAELYA